MNLPYFIARRYLFAKKSHNVINIISLISAIGIMVGTAALVITLSIYNGFEHFVSGMYGKYEADLLVSPLNGKTMHHDQALMDDITRLLPSSRTCRIIEDNAFLNYDGAQGLGLIRGVDSTYQILHDAGSSILDGDFELYYGEIPQAIVGTGLAREMHIRPRFMDPLEIYYPKREGKISLTNPLASINRESVFPIGRIGMNQKLDQEIVIIPSEVARRLMGLDKDEFSYLEVMTGPGQDIDKAKEELSARYSDRYRFQNRYQQNETVYKMTKYEKIAIYMILAFIILVITFNVFGSLTMLIIEKEHDISTLRSMGADYRLVRDIFVTEGWLVCISGMVAGLLAGILLCLIQQHFGILKMPGNFVLRAYPVILELSDVLLTALIVGIISIAISSLPTLKILPNIYKKTHNEE